MAINIFKRDLSEYKTYINPVEDYLDQTSLFFSRKYKIPLEQVREYVKEAIKLYGGRNPKIRMKEKNEHGDMEIVESRLLTYINTVKKEKNIIVPSFTVYAHPDKKKSVHSKLLDVNVELRKKDKALAFQYERENDMEKASFYTTNQKTRKVENNSLSGAYASPSTILYNPSSHSTLTSMTRCVSGIGNAISESLVAGNRYFRTPNSVINYIITVTTKVNLEDIKRVVDKYNLTTPTPKDVFSYFKESYKTYWKNTEKDKYIYYLLKQLDPYMLSAVMYVNDMWSLKLLNENFVRDLLTKLSFKVKEGSTDYLKDLDNEIAGVNELVHYIFYKEIKGLDVNYKDMLKNNDPLLKEMASTAKHIKEVLLSLQDLIKTFYVTDILPVNIAYIRDMYRKVIVLSDTDSTCCSYDKWVEWYFGSPEFRDDSVGVAASIMTITTQVMAHNLNQLAKNMNTGELRQNYLSMKNEFYWTVFVTANVTKHYYASTAIQEGNVFKKNKLEKKGVHYISSTVGGDIVQRADEMMWKVMNAVTNNEKLSVIELCREVASIEREIVKDFESNKCYMFRKDSIKNEKSYKQSPEESKYVNHILWNDVFAEQYGLSGEPPYTIYTIPLKVSNNEEWGQLMQHIKKTNPKMAQDLGLFITKYKKPRISTLRIPKIIGDKSGVPVEFREFVDIRSTVIQALRPLYYILETVGYYKKPEYMLSELNF